MSTRTHILVLLDGSPFSQRILTTVRRFFSAADHSVTLLHVADPPRGGSGATEVMLKDEMTRSGGMISERFSESDLVAAQHPIYDSQIEATAAANLATEFMAIEQELKGAGYAVSTEIRFGDAVEEIVTFIEHNNVALVAMTTHGRSGLGRMVLGSVAEELVRRVSVPVLLLRPTKPKRSGKQAGR